MEKYLLNDKAGNLIQRFLGAARELKPRPCRARSDNAWLPGRFSPLVGVVAPQICANVRKRQSYRKLRVATMLCAIFELPD